MVVELSRQMAEDETKKTTRLTQEDDIKHGILLRVVCYILPLHTFCEVKIGVILCLAKHVFIVLCPRSFPFKSNFA
jgi:hypothetical protein